jgi:uncharacterized MAPEG superfamily protein
MAPLVLPYWLSVLGLLGLSGLSIVLALLSGASKGFAGALSGPVLPADDANRLYRIDRVHMNSVEALAPFVASAILAMMVGVAPALLAALVLAHLAIRLVHAAVYLRGGPSAKGGGLRTALYVAGAVLALALIVATGWTAMQ